MRPAQNSVPSPTLGTKNQLGLAYKVVGRTKLRYAPNERLLCTFWVQVLSSAGDAAEGGGYDWIPQEKQKLLCNRTKI